MRPRPQTQSPDPISITESPESIVIEITKPLHHPLGSSEALTDLLKRFLELYLDERIAAGDPDVPAMDDLSESSKASWWAKRGDDFLRDVDRED